MRTFNRLPAAALALLVATFAAAAAYAQDTVVTVPENLIGFVLQIAFIVISGVIAAFLPIILTRLASKYGLQIEQEKRDALQVTLTNAAGGLLQKLGERAKTISFDTRDPALKDAIDRVLKGAPDAVKWAGLSEAEIARRILEKVALVTAPNNTSVD